MKVHQIPVERHPTFTALWRLLEHAPSYHKGVTHEGDLWPEILGGPPDDDLATPRSRVSAWLEDVRQEAHALCTDGVVVRAAWYYPPSGGIGWHTNSNTPGFRAYVVRAPGGVSFMKTADGLFPDRNAHVNVFGIADGGAWHCVGAHTERWSIGLLLPDALAVEILTNLTP